jgi:hypothetical protein
MSEYASKKINLNFEIENVGNDKVRMYVCIYV